MTRFLESVHWILYLCFNFYLPLVMLFLFFVYFTSLKSAIFISLFRNREQRITNISNNSGYLGPGSPFAGLANIYFCSQVPILPPGAGDANVSLFSLRLKSAAPGDLGAHHTSNAGPGEQ